MFIGNAMISIGGAPAERNVYDKVIATDVTFRSAGAKPFFGLMVLYKHFIPPGLKTEALLRERTSRLSELSRLLHFLRCQGA